MFQCPGDGGPQVFRSYVCDSYIDCPGGEDEEGCGEGGDEGGPNVLAVCSIVTRKRGWREGVTARSMVEGNSEEGGSRAVEELWCEE